LKETVLARRYAKALFEIALERKMLGKVRDELHAFSNLLGKDAALRNFLFSPEHSRAAQKQAAEKAFVDRSSAVFYNFLLVLIEKRRQTLIDEIIAAFEALHDRHLRKMRALAITAIPMDQKTLEQLRASLSKSLDMDMELQNKIDPEILGGLVVQVEGKILDGSVRQHLLRLRSRIMNSRN
jgi:F-type H+-transporting ATPase subunit delta